MPPRTIVLPVKCSTLRVLHDKLFGAIIILLGVGAIPAVGYIVTGYPFIHPSDPYEFSMVFASVAVAMFGIGIDCIVICLVLKEACEKLPRLECIKDEPEEP